MTVSTKNPEQSTSRESATSNTGPVQKSGDALGDPLCDPLQASTGIFGADAVQMDGVDVEDGDSGGQAYPDVCRVPAAATGDPNGTMLDRGDSSAGGGVDEIGDQSGTMMDGSSAAPTEEKKKIPKGF